MKRIIIALSTLLLAAACGAPSDSTNSHDVELRTERSSLFARVQADGHTDYAFQDHMTGLWYEGGAQLVDASGAPLAVTFDDDLDGLGRAMLAQLQSSAGDLGSTLIPLSKPATAQGQQGLLVAEQAIYLLSVNGAALTGAEPHSPTGAEPHDEDGGDKPDDDDAEPHDGAIAGSPLRDKQSAVSAEPHGPATL